VRSRLVSGQQPTRLDTENWREFVDGYEAWIAAYLSALDSDDGRLAHSGLPCKVFLADRDPSSGEFEPFTNCHRSSLSHLSLAHVYVLSNVV
jgi:hypothetical protein